MIKCSYIIEGHGVFERMLWFISIASSLALAAIMVRTNMNDAATNPILTSINTIPLQVSAKRSMSSQSFVKVGMPHLLDNKFPSKKYLSKKGLLNYFRVSHFQQ